MGTATLCSASAKLRIIRPEPCLGESFSRVLCNRKRLVNAETAIDENGHFASARELKNFVSPIRSDDQTNHEPSLEEKLTFPLR